MGSWITQVIEQLGYVGIALLMALENVFPPIPSELIMPLAGYTAAQGELALWAVVVVGTIGTLVGTLPWYGLARWLDAEKVRCWVDRHGHWLTLDRRELERAEKWFGRHGRWVVAVGRLIPGIRTVISVPAGFCEMRLFPYLAYSAMGTLAWAGILAYLGSMLGERYEVVARYLDPVTWIVLGSALTIYLVRVLRMRRRNHARRQTVAAQRSDQSSASA